MNIVKVRNIAIGEGIPKICVPIVGITKEDILKQAMALEKSKVDMVEWRVDWFDGAFELDKVKDVLVDLRKELKELPLIFTFRTLKEGGKRRIETKDYLKLNEEIIYTSLVDIVDIELFTGDSEVKQMIEIAQNADVKVIVSTHDFHKTPSKEYIVNCLKKMQDLGADISKIAVMPKSKLDVLVLLEATTIMVEQYAKIPIITISMGSEGIISRLYGQVLGSSVTFGIVEKASAPGQINTEDLSKILNIINESIIDKDKNLFLGNNSSYNLFLIGFMGSGKTTISNCLSDLLKMEEVDMDSFIEDKENMSIPKIFKSFGEEYFRNCETKTLIEIQEKSNTIISCGGGIVLRDENIDLMKIQGKVVLLRASPKTIYERVKNSNDRPILNNNMNVDFISSLMEKRKDRYLQAADLIINTDNKSIKEVCEEIIEKLNKQ